MLRVTLGTVALGAPPRGVPTEAVLSATPFGGGAAASAFAACAAAFGYEAVGPLALRFDVIEHLANLCARSLDEARAYVDALGLGRAPRTAHLRALGYRVSADDAWVHTRQKRRKTRPPRDAK